MIHNRSAKKYLRRVRGMLPCSRKMKKRIIEQICGEVSLFLEDHPEADYNSMISRFGEPESIAASYVEGMGTAEILSKFRIRKQIVRAVAIVLAIIMLIWASTVTCAIISNNQTNGSYIETGISAE